MLVAAEIACVFIQICPAEVALIVAIHAKPTKTAHSENSKQFNMLEENVPSAATIVVCAP
jgi:hypothetical protein